MGTAGDGGWEESDTGPRFVGAVIAATRSNWCSIPLFLQHIGDAPYNTTEGD